MSLQLWFLLAVVAVACYYDLSQFRIPNWLSIATLAIGFVVNIYGMGILAAVLGAVIGFVPMLILYFCKGIGAGDVKLFAGLGALLGSTAVVQLMMLSFIFGGVISLLFIGMQKVKGILKKKQYASSKWLVAAPASERLMLLGIFKTHQFPFMLAVAPAAVVLTIIL